MISRINHPTNYVVLRRRLETMLHERLDRADECKQDDPALEGHLTAAIYINAALVRVDNGTYGICRQCDGPIGLERIEAVPEAALCIDCQQTPRPLMT